MFSKSFWLVGYLAHDSIEANSTSQNCRPVENEFQVLALMNFNSLRESLLKVKATTKFK